jgi:nitronate monooxygenase
LHAQVLLDERVPVIAFYFGLPEQQLLSRIQAAGAFTMATVTCLEEAQKLQAAGGLGFVVPAAAAAAAAAIGHNMATVTCLQEAQELQAASGLRCTSVVADW